MKRINVNPIVLAAFLGVMMTSTLSSAFQPNLTIDGTSQNQITNKIVVEVQNEQILLRFDGNLINEQAKLVIRNSSGQVVLTQEVEVMENQIFKVINKKDFKSGEYKIELIGEEKTITTTFSL